MKKENPKYNKTIGDYMMKIKYSIYQQIGKNTRSQIYDVARADINHKKFILLKDCPYCPYIDELEDLK